MTTPLLAVGSERALLGRCLTNLDRADDVTDLVAVEHFTDPANRAAFEALFRLRESGAVADAATVLAELNRLGQAAAVGGEAYLARLAQEAAAGGAVEFHAARVRDAAVRRGLTALAQEVVAAARDGDEPTDAIIETADGKLSSLGVASSADRPVDAQTVLAEQVQRIRVRQQQGEEARGGVMTGFTALDDLMNGLHPGTLTLVAARTSVGKTALAMGVGVHATGAGVPVLFVSLEMSREELGVRLLAMVAGVGTHRIGNPAALTPAEAEKLNAVDLGHSARLWIDDRPGQTVARIATTVRRAVRRHVVGLVVVDYVGLVRPENPRDARHLQVGAVGTRLKELARTAKVPVVALAQLNREVESRNDGRPRLSDLRDSGQLEQDADAVILLHPRPCAAGSLTQEIELLLEKNRHGPRGAVNLVYSRPHVRFQNPADGQPKPEAAKAKRVYKSDDRSGAAA